MERFFNMDNKFFNFMGRIADLVMLNVVCIICCLPIVTIGASLTALHYVTLKMARNEEAYIIRSFFKSFKDNFKQATIINVIMLIAGALLYFDLSIVNNMQGTMGKVLFVLLFVLVFLYSFIFLYIYPVLAKFYNTIRNTFVNAFLMAIRHLPYTILMLIVTAAPVAVFFIPSAQVQSMVLMLFIMMGASLLAFVNAHFFVKIFDNYVPKEEEDTPEEISSDNASV